MTRNPTPKSHAQVAQPAAAAPASSALGPGQWIFVLLCIVLVLWLAYRIGRVILRLVAGLIFLGLVAYGIWYLFIK